MGGDQEPTRRPSQTIFPAHNVDHNLYKDDVDNVAEEISNNFKKGAKLTSKSEVDRKRTEKASEFGKQLLNPTQEERAEPSRLGKSDS